MAEIKEIKEKSQKDDDVVLSVAAGNRHSIIPNLEFEFTDTNIHEDVFKIVKFSCEEVCTTKEQLNKVLKLWTTFLEPMLRVPSRPDISDGVEDMETSTRVTAKNDGGNDRSPSGDNGKPACNGNDSNSPKRVDSNKGILVNGPTLIKEDGLKLEKDVKNASVADKALVIGPVNDNIHEVKSNIVEAPSSQV